MELLHPILTEVLSTDTPTQMVSAYIIVPVVNVESTTGRGICRLSFDCTCSLIDIIKVSACIREKLNLYNLYIRKLVIALAQWPLFSCENITNDIIPDGWCKVLPTSMFNVLNIECQFLG
jgi:hypothetical protein